MEGHRDYPDEPQPRWYAGDQGWDARGGEDRSTDAGFRVPEPRDGDSAEPGFGAHVGAETGDRFGGRYAEPDQFRTSQPPMSQPPGSSFPGFATGHPTSAPPAPDLAPTPLSPAAFPTVPPAGSEPAGFASGPGFDAGPGAARFAADPAATAERPRMLDLPTGPVTPVGARPGDPAGEADTGPRYRAEPIDRSALRRPAGPTEPVGGVYSTRRPAVAILLTIVAALLEIPALQLVFDGAFGDTLSASAVISGSFLMTGLPAFALGLYALVTGAGRRPDQSPGTAWLRPPLAYLPVGLVLFVAAALAAG